MMMCEEKVSTRDHQPDAREGQAGPGWESDRPIVPKKPGNAGGGKGPDFGSGPEVARIGRVTMLSSTSHHRIELPRNDLAVR